jgi:hypothetical protein
VEAVREALLTHETIDAIIVVELLPDVGNAQNCLSRTSPTGWAATSATSNSLSFSGARKTPLGGRGPVEGSAEQRLSDAQSECFDERRANLGKDRGEKLGHRGLPGVTVVPVGHHVRSRG